jgi:hypothetical protein
MVLVGRGQGQALDVATAGAPVKGSITATNRLSAGVPLWRTISDGRQ